jgi:hypothetical protein
MTDRMGVAARPNRGPAPAERAGVRSKRWGSRPGGPGLYFDGRDVAERVVLVGDAPDARLVACPGCGLVRARAFPHCCELAGLFAQLPWRSRRPPSDAGAI